MAIPAALTCPPTPRMLLPTKRRCPRAVLGYCIEAYGDGIDGTNSVAREALCSFRGCQSSTEIASKRIPVTSRQSDWPIETKSQALLGTDPYRQSFCSGDLFDSDSDDSAGSCEVHALNRFWPDDAIVVRPDSRALGVIEHSARE